MTKKIQNKESVYKDLKQHAKDVGSSEVRIAILTERIRYLTEHFEKNKKDLIWTLLARNINLNSINILKYLENIEFDDKNNYMSRLIINIEDWEDNQLIVFFEKYILYQPPSNNGMPNIWYL